MPDASFIVGKWVNTLSTETGESFMEALGLGFAFRYLFTNWRPNAPKEPAIQYILHKDGKITEKMIVDRQSSQITFELGVEFEGEVTDAEMNKVTTKNMITLDGNKLIHKFTVEEPIAAESVTIREFNGDEMVATHVCYKHTCTRRYKIVYD